MPFASAPPAARTCSIDEQLALTHEHEYGEMLRYRGLALSFMPAHPHISQLMAMLGVECEQRLADLDALAQRLQRHHCLPVTLPPRLPPGRADRLHLFIPDDAVACQVLADARATARETYRFTRLQARCTQVPELAALLERFASQHHNEWCILDEAQETTFLNPNRGASTPSLGTSYF